MSNADKEFLAALRVERLAAVGRGDDDNVTEIDEQISQYEALTQVLPAPDTTEAPQGEGEKDDDAGDAEKAGEAGENGDDTKEQDKGPGEKEKRPRSNAKETRGE